MKQPAVYMMANRKNGTLYTGVTSNLPQRASQHRAGTVGGFTKQYGCKLLVWYEVHSTIYTAITREKQIKAGFGVPLPFSSYAYSRGLKH
jgi:putative endonuclease